MRYKVYDSASQVSLKEDVCTRLYCTLTDGMAVRHVVFLV
jgi:hypothetical protein